MTSFLEFHKENTEMILFQIESFIEKGSEDNLKSV